MDYNARHYDPYLNRWLQPDTIIPDPYNPLDWDRYAYAANNPVRYSDPSGHTYCDHGKCRKPTGGKTNHEKAIDTANSVLDKKLTGGGTPTWLGLSEQERYTLEVGGWTEGEFTDFVGGGVTDVSWSLEDPINVTYWSIVGIYVAGTGVAEYLCWNDGDCTNEAQALTNLGKSLSTGRNTPQNLAEQLAMEAAKADPLAGKVLDKITMTDPRWPASSGWVKMQQVINGIVIHYNYNTITGQVADFKFK